MSRFKAEYAGKMNLYLKLLDEKVKLPHENNSIGLILCTDRNDVEVDYILPEMNRPMFKEQIVRLEFLYHQMMNIFSLF